ncbi:oligoendopeptidase F [Spiroplasma chinense]|uniref:Oligoendopeptidase F n=1 Tax=Spiroplasma chinense TaxID=216932 RepID=A0A5B9Y535_9MOLU|nr:M3 family metallopeptidase [Spiroplasma chinense]QEH61799.1 oligoendopeptidase F [Spiroplasma chinense]
MKRQEVLNNFKWNVSDIYTDEKSFKKDLKAVIEGNLALLKYKGKLNDFEVFKDFFIENEKINEIEEKIGHYFKILEVEQNNKLAQRLESIYQQELSELDGKFTWINEEIKHFDQEKFLNFIKNDNTLKSYLQGYKEFFKNLKYLLPYDERELLSLTSSSSCAMSEMYNTLLVKDNIAKEVEILGQNYKLDNTTYSQIMSKTDPIKDQFLRAQFAKLYRERIKENKYTFTKIYDALIRENIEYSNMIGMDNYFDYYFDDEDFYKTELEVLTQAVKENQHLFKRYLKLYKTHFNFKEKFYNTDTSLRFAKEKNETYSVEQAKEIIRESLKVLGPEYLEKLENSWSDYKVDYYEDENKSEGAFTINSYNFDTLVSMNWTDDMESVYTLTHEIGHAVHFDFARQYQPKPLHSFGNIIAEVASTLNEHLLSDHLLKNEDIDGQINILQNKIDFLVLNIFSSVRFTKFEMLCHQLIQEGKSVTQETLKEVFEQVKYGIDFMDEFEKDVELYSWIDISHLFEQPFYLHKYAVSVSVAFKIYTDFKEKQDPNIILDYLKMGGSLEPMKLFEKVGFDCKSIDSYKPIMSLIEESIDKLEELLNKKTSV